jgi:hypothetical protein
MELLFVVREIGVFIAYGFLWWRADALYLFWKRRLFFLPILICTQHRRGIICSLLSCIAQRVTWGRISTSNISYCICFSLLEHWTWWTYRIEASRYHTLGSDRKSLQVISGRLHICTNMYNAYARIYVSRCTCISITVYFVLCPLYIYSKYGTVVHRGAAALRTIIPIVREYIKFVHSYAQNGIGIVEPTHLRVCREEICPCYKSSPPRLVFSSRTFWSLQLFCNVRRTILKETVLTPVGYTTLAELHAFTHTARTPHKVS